jgi:hypothetical protein
MRIVSNAKHESNEMPEYLLEIIDVFFLGFHSVLILFNVFGWLVPRWRFANFITLSLTAFSWFILGIWYGWGYCFCTDWHWQVRDMLGYQHTSSSYIHFLILELTGINLPVDLVDTATVIIFFVAFVASAYLNVKKWKTRKR